RAHRSPTGIFPVVHLLRPRSRQRVWAPGAAEAEGRATAMTEVDLTGRHQSDAQHHRYDRKVRGLAWPSYNVQCAFNLVLGHKLSSPNRSRFTISLNMRSASLLVFQSSAPQL